MGSSVRGAERLKRVLDVNHVCRNTAIICECSVVPVHLPLPPNGNSLTFVACSSVI
jgi:hypothetical protein